MNGKAMQRGKSTLMLLLIISVLVGCGPLVPPSPTSTAAPTRAPTSTSTATRLASPTATYIPIPTSTPMPLQAPGWEEVTVHTLCLEVEQSYPEIEEEFSQPIAEVAQRILAGVGLQVVAEGVPCEATLTIVLRGKALGATYSVIGVPETSGSCYTGAEVNGEINLAFPGRVSLIVPISGRKPTTSSTRSCPSPLHAPFEEVWLKALLDGLDHLWGSQVVIQALRDEDIDVRQAAAEALGEIGPEEGVISALIQALEDEDRGVRQAVAEALGKIGPEEGVVPALIQTLEDEEEWVRVVAVRALGEIGPEEGVVPALLRALRDEDRDVRQAAVRALGEIGPEEGVIPALIQALEDEDVRQVAAYALGEIGPEAREAVAALIQVLEDPSYFLRGAAAYALGEIGPEAKEAVPALIRALEDEKSHVRTRAAEALEAITGQDSGWQQWWEGQQ